MAPGKRSEKAGLSPGSLIFVGEPNQRAVRVAMIDYGDSSFQETELERVEECFPYRDQPTVTWINVEGVQDVGLLERLGNCFQLHPLILEDILNTEQRPKIDDMGNYIYVVLKMIDFDEAADAIVSEQVSLVLGENFVISFQEGRKGDVFEPVRERIRSGRGRIRRLGADYLAYALIDSIVDRYFYILERIGEQIETQEEALLDSPSQETLQCIHRLKRDMLSLRKSIWPLREAVASLEKSESDLIRETTGIFLRDVHDHVIQVIDTVETYRETLASYVDIYLSSVSNRMNQVMKVLTIIATIFMPLTFIAGIYGMNFHFMPELGWRWGYPLALLLMVGAAGAMLHFFKRRNWW
jgi:magnesium transporter